jgi:3-oxoacyl-[acyl-carrier-protein] synthase-1
MPGQAAAAVLLEKASPRAASAPPRALLRRVLTRALPMPPEASTGEEPGAGPPRPDHARALAEVIAASLTGSPDPVELYGDLNGEEWRAAEWGTCLVHLQAASAPQHAQHNLPAIALGDTGAASGAIALCLAVRAFERGYARAPRALVWSRSDQGWLGAAVLEPARRA